MGVIVCGRLWSRLVTWVVRVEKLVWWVGTTMNQNQHMYNLHKQLTYNTRRRWSYCQPEHLTSSSANVLLDKRHGLRTYLHYTSFIRSKKDLTCDLSLDGCSSCIRNWIYILLQVFKINYLVAVAQLLLKWAIWLPCFCFINVSWYHTTYYKYFRIKRDDLF